MCTTIIRKAVFLLFLTTACCLSLETNRNEADKEVAAEPSQEDASLVLVTLGDKQLTVEQAKWALPADSVINLVNYANFWVETELLYEEAQRQGITEHGKEAFLADINRKKTFGQFVVRNNQINLEVTDEEVKEYYDKNKVTDPYIYIPAIFAFSHIQVGTLREAENAIKFIKAGEDFNELAKKVSIAEDAEKGGKVDRLGPALTAKKFGREFRDALEKEKASIGRVIGPIKVSDHYEVVRLEGYTPTKPRPFERMKGRIKTRMLEEKRKASYDKLINELKGKTKYKIEKSKTLLEMEKETESKTRPVPPEN
jgi:parvulin-like peptidyl-prolyl isomerase